MKILHGLVGILLFLLVAITGAWLVYGTTYGEVIYWPRFLELLKYQRALCFCAGVAIILLLLLFILTSMTRKRSAQYISFDGEKGAVSISIKAVRDFIQKIGDEFAAVLSIQPVLEFRRGALDVDLNVRVASGSQIPELCQMLQDRVMECLHDQLGISEIRNIRVNVQEISGRTSESKGPKEEQIRQPL